MLDSGGGGYSDPVGSNSSLIAAAAAKAELMHSNWESTGDYSCKREIIVATQVSSDWTSVEINTLSGEWTAEGYGAMNEINQNVLVSEATSVVQKWPSKIDGLFTKWQGLPSPYTSFGTLEWAAKELNIDPDNPDEQGDDLGGVNTRLAGDIERLKSRTSDLNGHYAREFSDYYVNDLPTTIASQDVLLASLSLAGNAQAEIWKRTDADLMKFQEDALAAMKDSGPEGGPNGDLVLGLTVVGALAGALAAVPTLGGSVALFTAISTGTAIGAGFESAKTADTSFEDLPMGAGHPDKVFANMEDALDALDTQIRVQETGIQDFLEAAKGFADSGACELTPPGLNNAPANEVLSQQQQLVVNKQSIAEITQLWLPSLAADLRQAERYLGVTVDEGFHRDTDVGLAPNGAWAEFNALQTRASALMTGLAGDLERAADKLHEAAAIIGKTDADIDQHFRKIEHQVELRNLNDPDDVRELL